MHIVHGTWVPHEPAEFIQDGDFCLWVEQYTPDDPEYELADQQRHPQQLFGDALATFLAEKLKLSLSHQGRADSMVVEKSFLLPTLDDYPLPSFELLPYVECDIPDAWELRSWQICCYRLPRPIAELNDLHFTALHAADDFQLSAGLLFWWQFSQELKRVILADQYLPALRYRSVKSASRQLAPTKKKTPMFEVYGGWQLCSDAYEAIIQRYTPAMPPACAGGSADPSDITGALPETLLRHFSACTLQRVVTRTPRTAKLDQQLAGTLLAQCVQPAQPTPGSEAMLTEFRNWAGWHARLTASQTDAGFTLCFRLEEASVVNTDDSSKSAGRWHVQLLVASKRDPSLKIELGEYWQLPPHEKQALWTHLGSDFERHLLLALGHAARVYPKVWTGLETERPSGFALTLAETHDFLTEAAWVLEDAGYIVMVPSWWTRAGRRRARIRLTTSTRSGSTAAKGYFSLDTIVDYSYQLSIDGQPVSDAEWQQLVAAKTPLVQFRGQWMELNRDELQSMLALWSERRQEDREMTLLDLMKLAAEKPDDLEWEHDGELEEVLATLQDKNTLELVADPPNFRGTLREYQKRGVSWLRFLDRLRLNPCLADDMGLGKTIQVLAQLVAERNEQGEVPPTLLIAPTSVLGNWRKEAERFAPHLRVLIHHGASRRRDLAEFKAACAENDIVITSFALARLDEKLLRGADWRRIVVDEAQNIKNPASAQTKAITKLAAPHRLALTGTPVENRLRDLWSIFHFLNPGYLGKEAQFRKAFELPIQKDNDPERAATLKRLIEPFILRRLKTDRQIIQDLPDKVEQKVYCNLTAEQASLYEAVVRDVEQQLEQAEGMQRRGLILSTLMKLKQVCNHPAQFLHDGSSFIGERSHKLQRLSELVEEAVDGGESLLIFTQFTEIGAALDQFIRRTLHYPTYYLHGGTPMARREQMVETFQNPETGPSVFILSVRAGGTGLTLTKANHVFHFDRWWNPAVEDQATDRAFRIGQRKNVFAHKFVTLGTVEERIDQMIEDKKQLAEAIVGSDESWLTELDNETFKDLIALRRSAVLE